MRCLIRDIKKCKCDPNSIDIVSQLQILDSTQIFFRSNKLFNIAVMSGIRQGCTLSPLLFIMVVNRIIRSIQVSGIIYGYIYFSIVLCIYDAVITPNDREWMKEMVGLLTQKADEGGLQISQIKSKCVIINKKKEEPKRIRGIKVVNQANYTFNPTRNISNMASSLVTRSCKKLFRRAWQDCSICKIVKIELGPSLAAHDTNE